MDLLQRFVELFADARDGDLSLVTLCLQASDGLSRALAVFGQLLRGSFELGALGLLQLRGARRGRRRWLHELER